MCWWAWGSPAGSLEPDMKAQGGGNSAWVWEWTHPSPDEGRQAWVLRPGEPRSSCCPQGAGQMDPGGSRGLNDRGHSPGLLLCCLQQVTQPL